MIARNKMKIVILSIVACAISAVDAAPDGVSHQHIYGSNQVQYQPQPTNYHYPQPHYGSQQQNYPAGYHPAQQQQQQHGSNQFSEQYLVTAIKHDPPPPPVIQYPPPTQNPFNGQSYIIEPSYLLKPYRPETTYHAQPYRPHNLAPYQPSYHPSAYSSYQVPTYPAPVYNQPPAGYQPYPAPPVYQQSQVPGSSVILVYTTPLLAGSTIQPTQTYASTESAVSPSQVQPVVETVVVESVTVKWSDILSADANELGQKYSDKDKIQKEKDVAKKESEEEEDDDEDDEKSSAKDESDSGAKKNNEGSSSENVTPSISYPIPANLTSKAVWKIPKTVASYVESAGSGTTPDVESVVDKSGDDSQAPAYYSTESETEESSSSKSSLTDYNQVGTTTTTTVENKESSETADQVTKISLQGGELAENEGRTYHPAAATVASEDNESGVVVELVTQVTPQQHEKPKSRSSVYYEQGPTNAGQEVITSLYEPVAEISQSNSAGIESEEVETEGTPVFNQVDAINYQQAPKTDNVIQVSESPALTEEVSVQSIDKLPDESEETTDAGPAEIVKTDGGESKELATSEIPIIETERPAYLPPYKPVVPKIFRPRVESEEVEPPETGFGERIKAFTKFALAVQKATHHQQQQQSEPVPATEPISLTPSAAPYTSEEVITQPESVSTKEITSSEINVNEELLHQPVSEYPTEVPTIFEASLFYRKPVAPESNHVPIVVEPLQEQEFSTEAPYKYKPIFYAQAAEKFTTPPASQTEAPNVLEPIKYEEPTTSDETSYGGRIVAEKMSPDEPVQVINAFDQFVYTEPSIAPVVSDPASSIAQLPVLDRDPMEKTENYATQRIYTASAEIPGDAVAASTPPSYNPEDENLYVSPAYIEEAGLSAEYQKEIAAAAQGEIVPQTSAEESNNYQTEIPNVSQEENLYSTEPTIFVDKDPVKVKSTEDISSEVSYAPVTDQPEKTESLSYEAISTAVKVKSAEELGSSEVIDAPVTDPAPYQENYEAISTTSPPKIKFAEEVPAEIVYAPVTESVPAYEDVAPAKVKSEEDVSFEVIDHAPVTDQYEATDYPEAPAITQELIPDVALPYDIHSSTSEPETATFVVGTMLQVIDDSSSESNEKNIPSGGSLPVTEHPLPCQTDKSAGTGHFHQFLFNPSSLANVPLDSGESSGEDTSTIAPTTVVPDLNTPSSNYNNESTSAERSTVPSDGYKYVFKSRPTPNRFYESRSTTAIPPSTNSTTDEPPTSRRPFVVIGKPIEMRKPINGRVYSRPSPIPQRKPQTLAQIKILPTRLRSSTSTIQLPNRRFFIGRTLTMTNEKNNRDSKEDEANKKDA